MKRVAVTYSEEDRALPYMAALEAAGVTPVLVPPGSTAGLDGFDGLLLTGGIDLNPQLYGQPRHPEADLPDDTRDQVELRLLQQALENDVPVLAICRGMQLFNVAHGGTLHQHIQDVAIHRRYDLAKKEPVHTVEVAPESKLAAITGSGSVAVNSRHHQAIAALGDGLVVSAQAADGVVEAVERPDLKFAVAVQWHPEDQAPGDPLQARLFSEFARSL